MGGAVAIVHRGTPPGTGLNWSPVGVLTEANPAPDPPRTAGSSGIASYTEESFVRGGGFEETLERAGPVWRATMRLAVVTRACTQS